MKVPHRSRVSKTRVLCKKNFTYSSVFKPYSDVLKIYSDVFLQKIFCNRFMGPYSGVFKPYNGVFKPYSDVFKPYSSVSLKFMEIESLKLDFHINFFLTSLSNRDLKTRVLS